MAKRRVQINVRSVRDARRDQRAKIAVEVMSGLIASRGQHPLESLKKQAAEIADVAVAMARELQEKLEKER